MSQKKLVHIVLVVLGFIMYAQTTSYEYALDDKMVITNNQITRQGFEGISKYFQHDAMDGFWASEYGIPVEELNDKSRVSGGRYRPLTLTTHSIEWALFGQNPGVSHTVNALLYGLLGLLIFMWLRALFKEEETDLLKTVSFWATVLFLVHPLHTEVVANIKGRDEILSMLFAIFAAFKLTKGFDTKKSKEIWIGAGLMFLSLLSKESAAPMVGVVPVSLWIFRNSTVKEIIQVSWQPLLLALLYILIRSSFVNPSPSEPTELMNNAFVNANTSQKWATIFLTVAAYVKLLFWPNPLTHDYYPYHLPFIDVEQRYAEMSHPAALLGLALTAILAIWSLWGIVKRKKSAFGAIFFVATFILVSNLLFPIGVFMNERFMFMPSLGFAIAVVWFGKKLIGERQSMAVPVKGLLVVAIAGFAILTFGRNPAWRNDQTLALTDVKVSDGSAKAHMAAGDALLKRIREEKNQQKKNEMINEAFQHLQTSLNIYPGYFPPLDLMAQVYFHSGNYMKSAKLYKQCADRKPGKYQFVKNIIACASRLKQDEQYQKAVEVYDIALSVDPSNTDALQQGAEVYARNLGNVTAAKDMLERALSVAPNDPQILQKMGIVYAMSGNPGEAIGYFEKAMQLAPNDASIVKNTGVTYMQLGNREKGQALLNKAKQLEAPTAQ